MANQEHLAFLKECLAENNIQKWNDWVRNTKDLPEEEIVSCVIPNVRKVDLSEADLRETNLRGADLRGVNLREVHLFSADLTGVNLREAYLREADLAEACLSGADLRGTDLLGADLRGVDLRGADLRGANLRVADLRGAYLREADLSGSDLRGSDLDSEQRDYVKSRGAILSDEPVTSELAVDLRAKEEAVAEIEQLNKKLQKIRDDTTKTEEEKKKLLDEVEKLQNFVDDQEEKTKKRIEDAIEHLQKPNDYTKDEIGLYKVIFKVYWILAAILGVLAFCTTLTVYSNSSSITSDSNLYHFLHCHGLAMTFLLLSAACVNLYSKTRQRVHNLEERKRSVETLRGILLTINSLESSQKILERIDKILDGLSDVAVKNFVRDSKDTLIEGEVDSFIERLRQLISPK